MKPIIAIVATSGEDRNKAYVDTISFHGGQACLLKPGDDFRCIKPHGVLLTGGGDLSEKFYDHSLSELEQKTLGKMEPAREQYELDLLEWGIKHPIPTLGICRGCQMLNIFSQGTLIPDIPVWQKTTKASPFISHRAGGDSSAPAHEITIEPWSKLYQILASQKQIAVNSSHHQALSHCGKSLVITAKAMDGIIEAIEDPEKPFWIGVQFHPERMWKRFPIFSKLFYRLLECAREKL